MKEIIEHKKEKNSWITSIISTIVTLFITVVISMTIYELQILFEKNKKQSEYLEKIYSDVQQIFLKKVELNNQALMFKIKAYKQYQLAIFKIINDNNSSNDLFDLYTKNIENLRELGDSTIMKTDKDFSAVLASADIAFIEDNLKMNIAFLELYSNKSLKKYQDEIFKSLSMIDTLYKNISSDIDISIIKMYDYEYVFSNINTNTRLLDFLNSLAFPKNTKNKLQNLQVENQTIAKELSYLTREILEDINIKLNGNKFAVFANIRQDKTKSFLED